LGTIGADGIVGRQNERKRTEDEEQLAEAVVANAIFGTGKGALYTFLRNEPNFLGEEKRC
jgi:hypothetical protein